MLKSHFRAPLLPVLVVAALVGCAPDASEEAAAGTPADQAPAAAAPAGSNPVYALVVTGGGGDFRAEGSIEQGQLLTVADDQGNGLGFRPIAVEPYEDSNLVSIEVVALRGVGAGETSQERVASLQVLEGGSGSVDPGDGEGAFRVEVESVSQP